MKIRINPWRFIWRVAIITLVLYFIVFLVSYEMFYYITFNPFMLHFLPWDYRQPLLLGAILILAIIATILAIKNTYFQLEDKDLLYRKFGKEFEFSYDKVEFIDVEQSKRKKMVIFYSTVSKAQYLLGDDKEEVLNHMIKKCKNVISKDDFRRRHADEFK